jgi:hypothetical protein
MSRNRKLVKVIRKIYQSLYSFYTTLRKKLFWLLRTFLVNKNRQRHKTANAGFVLPTVAMVSLVVVLLTVTILFRSFERSKSASNVRVNEAVLKAATPAVDRARAKINKLFQDSQLPRATPNDKALEDALTGKYTDAANKEREKTDAYTFGDETPLILSSGGQELRSAWRYPVDTDNNGKFDSYTVYGIYFKNPPVADGKYTKARSPVEARTPPMVAGKLTGGCEDIVGTSATLVGATGWTNINGKLKKSFYVYAATVPITDKNVVGDFEAYKGGNKGFSAIEYQQDRVQLPLVNNAVVYEDDIALAPGTDFNLNGRIITNSNFITGGVGQAKVNLYQVSSPNSCFYEDDNAKIIVGGNIGGGGFTDDSDLNNATGVHLFDGKKVSPKVGANIRDNKSVDAAPRDIAYNSLAYEDRITALVDAQAVKSSTSDPLEVKDGIEREKKKPGKSGTDEEIRIEQLDRYFRRRTRRVPYAEVAFNGNAKVGVTNPLQGSGDSLRPIDAWMYPVNPDDGKTETGFAKLKLKTNNDKLLPTATELIKLQREFEGKEQSVGDRVLVGNNLPEVWWDKDQEKFVSVNPQDTQEIKGIKWDNGDGTRTRRTRIEQLADLGATDRGEGWELDAAKVPESLQDPVGGLRVITGAGIYLPSSLTVASSAGDFNNSKALLRAVSPALEDRIWSDMMPVPFATPTSNVQFTRNAAPNPAIENNTPYLRMRATVVYHYKQSGYNPINPKPIACVSSYYDPTNSTTAKNRVGLPDVSLRNTNLIDSKRNLQGLPTVAAANAGNSNNGVVYGGPTKSATNFQAILNYQKELRYANGRWVNEPLKKALDKPVADRKLADLSAIDAAVCSLQILEGSLTPTGGNTIPHGAIMETTFLDARQVKAIHADATGTGVETFTNRDGGAIVPNTADYNLATDQRQPLEIRTTVLDVDLLRRTPIGSEFLIPNSGIIYATRDDALLDLSAELPAAGSAAQKEATQKRRSKVDFKLDPTRRPNAIMLVNGETVWRQKTYKDEEKGFILASNLPVYIKGNFNLHTQEEFTTALVKETLSNFYTRSAANLNPNFACRPGDPRLPKCTTGDEWRPSSVLSDAVNLLSANFREGYRNEGDFDLNNNLGDSTSIEAFKRNGFSNNAYVPNADWYNTTGSEATYPKDLITTTGTPEFKSSIQGETFQGSSYINNFVTPVQRRAGQNQFSEYLMEVCPKLPISACTDDDWKIDPSLPDTQSKSWNFKNLANAILDAQWIDIKSGSTGYPAEGSYQSYPRRVAFKRDTNGILFLDGNNRPVPLGIDRTSPSTPKVKEYPYGGGKFPSAAPNNALWFKTTTDAANPRNDNDSADDPANAYLLLDTRYSLAGGTKNNPILVPVLQINRPFGTPNATSADRVGPPNSQTGSWLQRAVVTKFNLAAAGGDTPARSDSTGLFNEDNGGLHNFVRFLENWNPVGPTGDAIAAEILGSFIQTGRSAYATGPFRALLRSEYQIVGNQSRAPFYIAPKRLWGYDVGLLSQSPDLFAQKLVRIPDDLPDEFFREVSRDDEWVKTLLCANKASDKKPAIDANQRPQDCE